MLNDEVLDKVIERVTRRIEQANTYVLEQIGKKIKKIGTLTPTKAQQLAQILKYGGDYNKIARKLAKITELNVKDVYKIFEEVAKNDYNFAGKFYKYRNRQFIPYEYNTTLQNQVRAMANLTANTYLNLSRTLAFAQKTPNGIIYTDLAKTYQETIDKAVTSVAQGKATFQEEMYRTIKDLSSSGLRSVDYASGRSYRLDSAVRMNLKGGLRTLHNEIQEIIGQDIDSDGVEISVHAYPAPDHQNVQGRQFSNEEYEKLNRGEKAKDYKGNEYTLDHDNKNGYRPISTMNCYHYVFSIVLGVSDPEYTDEQLKQIIEDNNKGFKLDGEKYTLYQGSQMQRQLELEIRKQKDTQIMAKASDNKELILESQSKITELTNKYKELCKVSGLKPKMERMKVSQYKRIAKSKLK